MNSKKTRQEIKDKLVNYAKENYKKSFIIGVSGGPNSSFLFDICKEITSFKTFGLHVTNLLSSQPAETQLVSLNSETTDDRHIELASTLAQYANRHDGLVLGTVDKTRGHLVRDYHKYGDGLADLFPIAHLLKSEIASLQSLVVSDLDELGAFGSSHQKKLNLTYDDIEWAMGEESVILLNNPQEYTQWFKYTLRQKEVIMRIHYLEKKTRHKALKI